jgi:hypothetical protein
LALKNIHWKPATSIYWRHIAGMLGREVCTLPGTETSHPSAETHLVRRQLAAQLEPAPGDQLGAILGNLQAGTTASTKSTEISQRHQLRIVTITARCDPVRLV